MLKMPTIVLGVFVAMILGSVARAGTPITFEFRGVITQRDPGSFFQVGDPFFSSVTFDPDAPDTSPQGDQGTYAILSFTVPTPRSFTPLTFGPGQARIRVDVEGGHGWVVERFGGVNTEYSVQFNYPSGTFSSDALPSTLSLQNSTLRRLASWDAGLGMFGEVTSIVVPEPGCGLTFLTALVCAFRRVRT
jgi:hypothetical protein